MLVPGLLDRVQAMIIVGVPHKAGHQRACWNPRPLLRIQRAPPICNVSAVLEVRAHPPCAWIHLLVR